MESENLYSKDIIVEELFRKYYKILRAYAYRLLEDKHMAEDFVQDVYYELWKKKDSLVMEDAIKSYLFRSLYTKILNYKNSKEYTSRGAMDDFTGDKIEQIYLQSHMTDQESELIYKELQREIHKIIDTLPEQCRKVFILSRKYELKNREIAEKLGISVKTVEKHISKALSVLRLNLKDVHLILLIPFFL
ncbi:MAG: RNA polymerase sigma-70 factor [Tannerella sp.]|jgi:RNA polymerase sigma-70 factor (ECF subfamily)|nr:RNA polymerase sigma-70 factor [Tannerella sp.]